MPGRLLFILFCLLAGAASAQTLQMLCSFNGTNGASPHAGLVQASDGNFYGTTRHGGAADKGTVFQMTPDGALTTLVSFNGINGADPLAGLVQATDGNFYGTTREGGNTNLNNGYGYGTVFRLAANGTLTTLASFNNTNGNSPDAGLVQGSDGNFYGTTAGAADCFGTVFQVTTNGALTTLASFNITNGAAPYAGLVAGRDGYLYGTTFVGGDTNLNGGYGLGTVFRMTTNGTLTTLACFNDTNGRWPRAGLVEGRDGNLYGTTSGGGAHNAGTIFRASTNGTLTTLVSFKVPNVPPAGLVLGTDGNFYGTTSGGGDTNLAGGYGFGTVFQMTTNGTLTSLAFFKGTNGDSPEAALVQSSDGSFYGTTAQGGTYGKGTVFRLVLPPVFVTQPQSQTGNAGATVTFSVSATSFNPLTYQWQLNGTNLPGQTNASLTLTNVQVFSAGDYTVVASSIGGSVTSQVARLTVLASAPSQVVGWGGLVLPHVRRGTVFTNIAAGGYHNLAIRNDGRVVAWGLNVYGQATVPDGLSNITAIAAGGYHSLALKSDHTVVAWGAGKSYTNNSRYYDYGQSIVPSGLTNVVAVAAGVWHSVALRDDGTVVAWGDNSQGQTNTPVGLSNVVAIAAGNYHSFALKSDSTVVSWGQSSDVPADLTNVVALAAGGVAFGFSLALKNDGSIVGWGNNWYGQTTAPAGLSNVVAITAGAGHTVVLKNDGFVVAWGLGTNDEHSIITGKYGQAIVPPGLSNVTAIAAGWVHTLALKSDGTLVGWGDKQAGQSLVAGLESVNAVSTGEGHCLALKSDGTVVA